MDDPVALARRYNDAGADELVFYDITASARGPRAVHRRAAATWRGRYSSPSPWAAASIRWMILTACSNAGADKVSVNSGAIADPALIGGAAQRYGGQCVVLSVDVARVDGALHVFARGGRVDTGLEALAWLCRGEAVGAGEIVLNCIDTDGVKRGFDLEMLAVVRRSVRVPVIASGGAGCIEDFIALFQTVPGVDAGLAAWIFHFGEVDIGNLKRYLTESGVPVRL